VGERFEVDLLAEEPNGDYVIIKNQSGKSDHDHLGKLLTYLANLGAKTAVWICEDPQPEHVEAINWLNKTVRQLSPFIWLSWRFSRFKTRHLHLIYQ